MEASGGVAAGGEGAAEATTETPGVDLGPLTSRLDEIGTSFTSRLDEFGQRLEQFEQSFESEEPDGSYDPQDFLDPNTGQIDMNQIAQLADQIAEKRLQERLEPLMDRVDGLQGTLDARELEKNIPELRDPVVAERTVQEVKNLAERFIYETGIPPEAAMRLVRSPSMVEMVHKAMYAERAAAGEEAAVPDSQELEAGGGAQPAGAGGSDSILQDIIEQRGGRRPNAFGI